MTVLQGCLIVLPIKVQRYLNSDGTEIRRYFSTTVQIRRYYEYYGTLLKCSCNEVRRYSRFDGKGTTEL